MKFLLVLITIVIRCSTVAGQLTISASGAGGGFPLATSSGVTAILYDAHEAALVQKVVRLLQDDIHKVTGQKPLLATSPGKGKPVILIGTTASRLIVDLVAAKKLDVQPLQGKWEAFSIQVVNNPLNGIRAALVIVGSDRRGVAFGVLQLSRIMGVSPWYWWANVPVKKQTTLYVHAGKRIIEAPKVKYRGLFINDEAPALSNWSRETFGGFNHLFYEKVFELLLRLKANYIWPAMWGNAFYDDDSLNRQTAEDWGMVIGTSHHEPLMRAHDEWRRTGGGKWSYESNKVRLQQFWKAGMRRATNEKIVTVGMRGDGDEPMSPETATALLEQIVADQRAIIAETTGQPANETPQLWALYKEVQDYYDKGMRVPDDVTLLFCDDNWGNIRRLPRVEDKPRKGGYGIYYHFDYVGGPRNYKWLNTNNLARVWEQMHLAYQHKAREIWIVNVGDIKPMELPTSFFLDYAWDPERWNERNLQSYYREWATENFGTSYGEEAGDILRLQAQYSSRKKPELLSPETYHLFHYDEAQKVTAAYKALESRSDELYRTLPAGNQDACYDLLLHPVKSSANLVALYNEVAWNRHYASLGDVRANAHAEKAKALYVNDSLLTKKYHALAGGKWNHLMSQTHIGYTDWQQPEVNSMPAVRYVARDTSRRAPPVAHTASRTARGSIPKITKERTFFEQDGVVSIEAAHWSRTRSGPGIEWRVIPDIGKTGSGITTFPVTASAVPDGTGPSVEFDFYSYDSGSFQVHLLFSPTLDFKHSNGLKFGVSVDGAPLQTIALNKESGVERVWEGWVANNIIEKVSTHSVPKAGKHTLKFWMISPGVVLQKAVLNFGGLKPSYLGPPETIKN